uniref:F-box protein AT5G49610-like beta-propeller domain-containing protein n=1 Tax=Hordeum vulgare subsp. vulgare TaxID=112509 RepID=A0A8I6WW35_HORVV
MFLPGDGGRNGITLLYLWAVRLKVYAELYVLGYGGWGVPATAVPELELSFDTGFLQEILPPVHVKVFVVTASGYTLGLGLDLVAASFFTLQLPVSVRRNYKLSCAEDSGLYLVGVDGFQLTVWLHRMSGNGNGAGWLLVDTFYVCEGEACTRLVRDGWIPPGDYLDVVVVGDNADFVFLDHAASGVVFYVHLRSRVVEKVHQRMPEKCWEPPLIALSPVVMIWPPVFPARDVGHDQEE